MGFHHLGSIPRLQLVRESVDGDAANLLAVSWPEMAGSPQRSNNTCRAQVHWVRVVHLNFDGTCASDTRF